MILTDICGNCFLKTKSLLNLFQKLVSTKNVLLMKRKIKIDTLIDCDELSSNNEK